MHFITESLSHTASFTSFTQSLLKGEPIKKHAVPCQEQQVAKMGTDMIWFWF